MINENHNKRILNYILQGKSNAGRPIIKYTVLTKGNTILKDVNEDDGVYLTTACYTMEN
jgi:hypothetical protein